MRCEICNKEFKRITHKHLLHHDITPNEYKQKFNITYLCNDDDRKKISIVFKKSRIKMLDDGTHPFMKQNRNFKKWYEDKESDSYKQICKKLGHIPKWKGKHSKDFYKNPEQYEQKVHDSLSKSMHEQYKTGQRDRFNITKEANKKCRELVNNNKHNLQLKNRTYESWYKNKNTDKYKQICNKISQSDYHKNGTWAKHPDNYPGLREQITAKTKKRYKEHPEQILNYRLAKMGGHTYPQIKLFNIIKKYFTDASDIFHINIYNNKEYIKTKWPDIYIPSLKLCIEFDGIHWHPDVNIDLERDKLFINQGYKMLHYRGGYPEELDIVSDIIKLKEDINTNGIYYQNNKVLMCLR